MAESTYLRNLAITAAQEAGVPASLFLGLVKTESDWDPQAHSGAGAIGLTQVMPVWASPSYAASIGLPGLTLDQLWDPETNLRVGARILAGELKRFGDPGLAAMAYNAGAGVVKNAVAKAGSSDAATVSPYLPAAETRAYWQKVENWAAYYMNQVSALSAGVENVATDVTEAARGVADSPGGKVLGLLVLALGLGFVGKGLRLW